MRRATPAVSRARSPCDFTDGVLAPRAGSNWYSDRGQYHLNVYCEDVDDDAIDSYYAVDQWFTDIDCDCSCYNSTSSEYHGAPAFLCMGTDNMDDTMLSLLTNPRCGTWDCEHDGAYCYHGGSDYYGCYDDDDVAGECCGTATPTVTPSPTVTKSPTLHYYAVDDRDCSGYIRLDEGGEAVESWYGAYYVANWVDLEECANAVHAYDGFDGCMGEHFYWNSYFGYCACARAPRVPPARKRRAPLTAASHLLVARARGVPAQATARRTPAPRATTTTTTAIARRTTASAPARARLTPGATAVRAMRPLG